jgi:prepilin-type N-terminal cleavage/methylation domain-containing protein
MKPIQSTRESGFTLLELLLVIGVAALLLIGGIVTYRLVTDGNKATETTRLLLTIRQEAQTLAQQQGSNYAGITFATGSASTTQPLVASGVLRVGQSNSFSGTITIGPVTTTNANDSLSVAFTNISQSACTKLAIAINNPNEVISTTVNATAFTSAGGTIPVTVAAAAVACANPVNTITWVFP